MFFVNTNKIELKLKKYFQRRLSEVDTEIEIYKNQNLTEIAKILAEYELKCNRQWNQLEHDYHQGRQDKMIELAKLDGEIKAKSEQFLFILQEKDKLIETLKQTISVISQRNNEENGTKINNVNN